MLSIASTVLRVFLLLCGAVVLGLSVTTAKHQKSGPVPPETGFGSFAGAFGIVASVVGLVALFIEAFPGVVALVADVFAALFYLAGGIAMAVAFKDVTCSDNTVWGYNTKYQSKLLNGGCSSSAENGCGIAEEFQNDKEGFQNALNSRCVRVQADYAFEFIACVFSVGAIILTWMASKRSGKAVF